MPLPSPRAVVVTIIGLTLSSACHSVDTSASAAPAAVAEQFFRAYDKGDYDAALTYLSAELTSLGDELVKEALDRDRSTVTCNGQLSTLSLTAIREDSTSADFQIELLCRDGRSTNGHPQLLREAGRWRVWEW
jgi:hypothetical protein